MLTKIYEQNPSERELRKVVDALEDVGNIRRIKNERIKK